METYKKHFRMTDRKPSTQELFYMLQQVSGEHCDILGYGMDKMGPQNLIWVVVRQKLELSSYPQAGEELIIETWPGPTRHGLFPRHYEIYASNGELIGTACALWTLVDVESRKMIKPEDYGVELQGITTGREKGNPRSPEKLSIEKESSFVVPKEYLDGNGHMNNTCYYKLAEEQIGDAIKGKTVYFAATEYANEALLGDELKVSIGSHNDSYYVAGETNSPIFKMHLKYK